LVPRAGGLVGVRGAIVVAGAELRRVPWRLWLGEGDVEYATGGGGRGRVDVQPVDRTAGHLDIPAQARSARRGDCIRRDPGLAQGVED
jgi:hypothetical protein